MLDLFFKECSKLIINNNNIILEKVNKDKWLKVPFYPEKSESDPCSFITVIQVENYVYTINVHIIDDDSYNNDENYVKIPLDSLIKLDLSKLDYIDGYKITIPACAILSKYIDKYHSV